jgi:hypothetical protein
LSLRWFAAIFEDEILIGAMSRSFWLALAVSLLSIGVALPCALVVERGRFRGKQVLETWITGPRMIPQLVLALALLGYFERVGLAESLTGLLLAHLVISIPFVFRTLLVSVSTMDRRPPPDLLQHHVASIEDGLDQRNDVHVYSVVQQCHACPVPFGIRRADASSGDVFENVCRGHESHDSGYLILVGDHRLGLVRGARSHRWHLQVSGGAGLARLEHALGAARLSIAKRP